MDTSVVLLPTTEPKKVSGRRKDEEMNTVSLPGIGPGLLNPSHFAYSLYWLNDCNIFFVENNKHNTRSIIYEY